jgi:D-alanyl-lipoteichoic acid acyltransferase DltB (MBOAT superfamily)
LLTFYAGLEGLLIVTVTCARLLGVQARDVLERPVLAVTPADFWRRYNRVIGQFLHEDVFLRVGGFRAPLRATMITFVISALAHEYLFGIAIGRVEGWQTAFFLVQGLAVAATVRLKPRGPWVFVSTAMTLAFNIATSFLFYASVDAVSPWW